MLSPFDLITRFRNALYDHGVLSVYKSFLPVISVGNISVGGNAKTPTCIGLLEYFLGQGRTPALILRGYGGSNKGPYEVRGSESSKEVGDEALLYKTALPELSIVVSRSRVAGIQYLERAGIADMVVLDDALQHRALFRDLDIVSVDVSTEKAREAFKAGRVLPFGRFREHKDRALKRVNAVILAERRLKDSNSIPDVGQLNVENVFRSWFVAKGPREIFSSSNGQVDSSNQFNSGVAVSAIANPGGFHKTLEALGIKVAAKVTFSDHHEFTRKDIESINENHPNLPKFCTEKDGVKLRQFPKELLQSWYEIPIGIEIEPRDDFYAYLETSLSHSSRSSNQGEPETLGAP